MLQLTHLRFTEPRRDSTAWLAFRQTMQAALANMDANPQKVFTDTAQALLTGYSPYARTMSAALLDQIDLDRAMAFYRDRFADASDFTFVLVGNFSVDSIRPLVERYLASLPGLDREDAGRDVGLRPARGRVDRIVRAGTEPQSQTVMFWTGPLEWNREDAFLIEALGEVLQNRLTDNLRETLGGTYSASVQAAAIKEPVRSHLTSVQFGSAPERVDELVTAIKAEIAALAADGPTAAEITKVREGVVRERETALRTNAFWAGQLLDFALEGEELDEILAFDEMLALLTPDRLQEAAKRFLLVDNVIKVTLLPVEAGT
jgi:zinc protease